MFRIIMLLGFCACLSLMTTERLAAQEKKAETKSAMVRIAAPPAGIEVVSGEVTCDRDVVKGQESVNVFPVGTSTTIVLLLRGDKLPGLTTEIRSSKGVIDMVETAPDFWGTEKKNETKVFLRCYAQPGDYPDGLPQGQYQTRVKMDNKVVLQFNWSLDPKSPVLPDVKRMQGKWRVIDRVADGRGQGVKGTTVTITADSMTLKEGDGTGFTRRLNHYPSENPKWMNLTVGNTDDIWPSLYGFQGDRLMLCIGVNGFRPGQMRSNRGDGTLLLELERIKQKK